ncbi:MAG: hypothetical protein ACLFVR_06095 [Thiohalospira sp.]
MIRFLENNEINFIRWDNCINNALNGNIFAFTWYLNIICDEWYGLILGDYEYVMPVIHRKFFNQKHLFTSPLAPQLGIYSKNLIDKKIVKKFIDTIPPEFSYIDINLNKYNPVESLDLIIRKRKTFELDLIQPAKKIKEKYTPLFKKELQLAKKQEITVLKGLLPNGLINFALKKVNKYFPILNKEDIQRLRMIIAFGLRYQIGEMYGAYNSNNELCAAAFFIKSKRKIHLMFSAINIEGEKSNALHKLIDKYIELHAEKSLTLNLENICITNKMDFLTGVGTLELNYINIRNKKLPWYIKLIK